MTTIPPPPPFPPSAYAPAPVLRPVALNLTPAVAAPRTFTLPAVQVRYVVGVVGLVIAGLVGHGIGHGTPTPATVVHHTTTTTTTTVPDTTPAHSQWWVAGHDATINAISEAVSEGTPIESIVAATDDSGSFCTSAIDGIDGSLGHTDDMVAGCMAGISEALATLSDGAGT